MLQWKRALFSRIIRNASTNNIENNETWGYKNRLRELVKPSLLTSNHIFITITDFAHITIDTCTAKASPNLSWTRCLSNEYWVAWKANKTSLYVKGIHRRLCPLINHFYYLIQHFAYNNTPYVYSLTDFTGYKNM